MYQHKQDKEWFFLELQFNKTTLPYLRMVTQQVQNQEQTQEIRLTDGMPDIGHVLASWGQLLVRGKEWRGSGMSVNGGVMTWVLYAPEDGGQPQCVEAWIPFQMKWDFPDSEHDGFICVQPLLLGVDARSTSARKLMVRAGISILGEAAVNGETELYTPADVPEDVQLLRKTYPLLLPKEAGEKAFTLDDVLRFPASAPQPERLIRYGVQPTLVEQKVMADKVVFRGAANLHVVYIGTDGQLYSWDFEMPFSQFAQLENDYSPEATACVNLAVTTLELDKAEEDQYTWKTGITAQYMIYEPVTVEAVEDAYSPSRTVVPRLEMLDLPAVLDIRSETWQPEKTMDFDGARVVDAAFYPEHPRLYREEDQVTAELGGTFQLLGYDGSGELVGATKRWEGSKSIPADVSAKVQASVQPNATTVSTVTGDGASLSTQLPMTATFVAMQGIPMVTGLEMGEAVAPDPDRPSLILRRAGESSLWEMAKQSGSTVAAIQSANSLQQEPDPGQMLLIPVL